MPISSSRRIHLFSTALLIVAAAACSGRSPMSPDDADASGQGAVIAGRVVAVGQTTAGTSGDTAAGSADSLSGMTVRVVGTNRTASVSNSGDFKFEGIPPGLVRLLFASAAVNATAEVGTVEASDVIQLQVHVSPTAAVIVSQERDGKVSLCHAEGNGSYHQISVATSAEPAHRAHGDGKIGDPVPGRSGAVFSDSCEPVGAPVGTTPKVTLCHKTGNSNYVEITVSVDAEPAHRAHGDAKVGEAVPNQAGKVFGVGCRVQ